MVFTNVVTVFVILLFFVVGGIIGEVVYRKIKNYNDKEIRKYSKENWYK